MTRRMGASSRAQALARAADAVARRDAERIRREKAVQVALAEFYQAQDEVERIHADAARAAEPFEGAARDAVRDLERLGETRTGISNLTGLPVALVREYLDCKGTIPPRPAAISDPSSESARSLAAR